MDYKEIFEENLKTGSGVKTGIHCVVKSLIGDHSEIEFYFK